MSFKIRELESKDVNKDTLLKLANYEKFIYLHGFTRRVIVEYKFKNNIQYRCYYYNLLNGVHIYIEIDPNELNKKLNVIFFTIFKQQQFVTYNKTKITILKESSKDIIEQYSNLDIQELYKLHLEHRQRVKDTIIKSRLTKDEILSSSNIKNIYLKRYIIKTALTSAITIISLSSIAYLATSNYTKEKNITKINTDTVIKKSIKNQNKVVKTDKKTDIQEPKKRKDSIEKIQDFDLELKKFNSKINEYKTITLQLNKNSKNFKSDINYLEKYLKNSQINRNIGKPTTLEIDKSILPCQIPDEIKELYKWHNGVENIIPDRDFYSIEQLVLNYNRYNKNSNYIVIFGEKNGSRGLAYNCNRSGLYEFDYTTNKASKKEFYSIPHFLNIVTNAYKANAFYDNDRNLSIDFKNYLNIYRKNLTSIDKKRYKEYINYLENRAKTYKKYGNKKLKLALLKEIKRLYDSRLTKSVALFLNDKDRDVKINAIETLGLIHDKNSIHTLIKYLK